MPWKDLPGYFIAQLLAALLACAAAGLFLGKNSERASIEEWSGVVLPYVAEFTGTFLLVFVILSVATSKLTSGNSYYGIANGGAVTLGIYLFGPFSGASFNPAVAIGLSLGALFRGSGIWVCLTVSFLAAWLASIVFLSLKFLHKSN